MFNINHDLQISHKNSFLNKSLGFVINHGLSVELYGKLTYIAITQTGLWPIILNKKLKKKK